MIKPSDILNSKNSLHIKALVIGDTGSGKSHFAATFPKSYFMLTEPAGEDTFMTKPSLRKNIVGFDRFIPENIDDTKRIFTELETACVNAREMAKSGEIESVILDNLTYLAENRFLYICRYEPEYSPKTGELDVRSSYGKLARWLYQFILMKLLTIPANLVITAHQKLESDEQLDKKPDKSTPVVASILGSFRDDISGMVSLILYLAKKEEGGKHHYFARTNMGQGRNAKSRYPNLPNVLENISYDVIREAILKTISEPIVEPIK